MCIYKYIIEKGNIWKNVHQTLNSGILGMKKSGALILLLCILLYCISYFYNKLITFGFLNKNMK